MQKRKYNVELNDRIAFVANVGMAFISRLLHANVLTGELEYHLKHARNIIADVLHQEEIDDLRLRGIDAADRISKHLQGGE